MLVIKLTEMPYRYSLGPEYPIPSKNTHLKINKTKYTSTETREKIHFAYPTIVCDLCNVVGKAIYNGYYLSKVPWAIVAHYKATSKSFSMCNL